MAIEEQELSQRAQIVDEMVSASVSVVEERMDGRRELALFAESACQLPCKEQRVCT